MSNFNLEEAKKKNLLANVSNTALTPAVIPTGAPVIPSPSSLKTTLQGKGSLIHIPAGVSEDTRITSAFTNLAKGNLHSAEAWEKLFLTLGRKRAGLYLATRTGWFRVRDVEVDEGGGTGVLRVTALGKAGRSRGVSSIDISKAVGWAIPTIWYRPHLIENALKQILTGVSVDVAITELFENVSGAYQHLGNLKQALRDIDKLIPKNPRGGKSAVENILHYRPGTAAGSYEKSKAKAEEALKLFGEAKDYWLKFRVKNLKGAHGSKEFAEAHALIDDMIDLFTEANVDDKIILTGIHASEAVRELSSFTY